MKTAFVILFSTLFSLNLLGQESEFLKITSENRKEKGQKQSESDWLNLISVQTGFSFGIHSAFGLNFSLSYERKIENKPIAWFVNYTVAKLYDTDSQEARIGDDSITMADEFTFVYHHFGGGIHYYPLNYERRFKPYIGVGLFLGMNRSEWVFYDEDNYKKNGFDIGGYGVIGARWFNKLFQIGTEYRVGYLNAEVMDSNESYSIHEIVIYASVKF